MAERYFDVTYLDGAVVKVKPLPRAKWADMMELQQSLLEQFFLSGLMAGTLLVPSNKKAWSLLQQAVTLLPTISGEPLELDEMDSDEIMQVFFTGTTHQDEDGAIVPESKEESHLPSRIAKLHGFAFFLYDGQGLMDKARESFIQEIKGKQKVLKKEIEKKQTPMPTP